MFLLQHNEWWIFFQFFFFFSNLDVDSKRDLYEVGLFSDSVTIGYWRLENRSKIPFTMNVMEHTGHQIVWILLKLTDPISDIGAAQPELSIPNLCMWGNTFSENKIHEFIFDVW